MNPYESPTDPTDLSATKWTWLRVIVVGLFFFVACGFITPAFMAAKESGPCRIRTQRDSTAVIESENEAVPNYKCTPTEDEMPKPTAIP